MSPNHDGGLLPRTYFRCPRVPFDFRALALGILGYLVFWGGGKLLNVMFDKPDMPGAFLLAWASLFEGIPYIGVQVEGFVRRVFSVTGEGDYTFWHTLVSGAWFFVVWSFFGQAIHRITSLRIARDENMGFGEALRFSARNWVTVLCAPLIIGVILGIFYAANMLTGVVTSIPWIGGLLGLILIPLSVIATLLILLIGLGGVAGLPLIGASAAWEVNGALDAISRAFSYVFARPLQYFWNLFLVFMFAGVILLVGSWFTFTLTKSIDSGTWSDVQEVQIDAPQPDMREDSDYAQITDEEAKRLLPKLREKTGYEPGVRRPGMNRRGAKPFAMDFQTVIHSPWGYKLNALIFWAFLNLIWLGVFGYAIYWFIGACSSIYADLRADVDGTPEDEIYLEEDDAEFESMAEQAGSATDGAAAAAADKASAEATEGATQEAGEGGATGTADATDATDAPEETDADTPSAEADAGAADEPSGEDADKTD